MIAGGIAASILGRPRATRDIDALAVAPDDQWTQLLGSSKAHGILPRIEKPLEFARRTRVLLLRHTESGIDIDIILSGLPFEAEAVSRATMHDLSGVQVRLPQVEDLLIMKAIAHRPQDLRDIEGLVAGDGFAIDASVVQAANAGGESVRRSRDRTSSAALRYRSRRPYAVAEIQSRRHR